jgi:hypothetical protein
MKSRGSLNDSVYQIPKLRFLEFFSVHCAAVDDLITEKIGIVFILNLNEEKGTMVSPPLPQNYVLSNF